MSVLEVKGVGYYYFSDKPVLRDICLSFEKGKYGKSQQLKYLRGCGEPVYPVSYVKYKNPIGIQEGFSCYIPQDREKIHTDLRLNTRLLKDLMLQIQSRLFDFDFGAGVFELLGDFFGFGLCNAFLDGLGSAFN